MRADVDYKENEEPEDEEDNDEETEGKKKKKTRKSAAMMYITASDARYFFFYIISSLNCTMNFPKTITQRSFARAVEDRKRTVRALVPCLDEYQYQASYRCVLSRHHPSHPSKIPTGQRYRRANERKRSDNNLAQNCNGYLRREDSPACT